MKIYKPFAFIALILLIDQFLKVWIKLNMYPGEHWAVLGDWFYIYFTENNGMAFGLEFAGESGKLLLTLFRIIAAIAISWYLVSLCRKNTSKGLIISIAMILAGALGNIIDSIFYGAVFGYEQLMYGKVVDMFYFPLIEGYFPSWFPLWAGEEFIFFRPIFNIADSSITIGVFLIIIFQRKFFPVMKEPEVLSENTKVT